MNRLRLSTAPSKKSLSHILRVKFKLKSGNEKFRVINFDNSEEDTGNNADEEPTEEPTEEENISVETEEEHESEEMH